MSTTPNIALTEYPTGALTPSAPYNDSMQVIDALMRPGGIIQDKDLTTPPTTVSADVGKRWIIPIGASGAWAGKTDQIALCTAATLWRYFVPAEGWRVYILDENQDYIYTASSTGWDPAGAADVTSVNGGVGAVIVLAPIIAACSDETTALTAGTSKLIFRNPYATVFNVTAVKASLSTAQTSGSIFTVDINESGSTILSTKITIDNTEKTSTTAATQPVISDASIAADAELSVDIDQIGDGTAKGLKVTLVGYAGS